MRSGQPKYNTRNPKPPQARRGATTQRRPVLPLGYTTMLVTVEILSLRD